jgi:hypothetical protein
MGLITPVSTNVHEHSKLWLIISQKGISMFVLIITQEGISMLVPVIM